MSELRRIVLLFAAAGLLFWIFISLPDRRRSQPGASPVLPAPPAAPQQHKAPEVSLKFVAGNLGRTATRSTREPRAAGYRPRSLLLQQPRVPAAQPLPTAPDRQPAVARLAPAVRRHLSEKDRSLFDRKQHLVREVYYKVEFDRRVYACDSLQLEGRQIKLARARAGIPFETDLDLRAQFPAIPILTLERPLAGARQTLRIKAIAIVKW